MESWYVARGSWFVRITSRITYHVSRFTLLSLFCVVPAHAASISLIRDAEIEHTLRLLADPIFEAAGLEPSTVKMFIVGDDVINAYVAGGKNIFLYTGLLLAMEKPNMLIGVIAHETGHIAGGHLARGSEHLRNAQIGAILGYVLGAAAAVASGGRGDAAVAVMTGTQQLAMRNLLAFTRGQENSADTAGIGFMTKTGISASGMLDTFELLRRKESQQFSTVDPYAVTHPLSADRIEHVRAEVEKSPLPRGQYPAALDEPFQRMRAKLYAFLELPPRVFARYPASDKSIAARLARAVAWYRTPDLDKSLSEMDSLLKDRPKDAFLYDMKGQILFEHGKIAAARAAYEKAVSLLPNSALLLTSLAQTEIASGDSASLQLAITHLEKAISLDNSNGQSFRLLAGAYGKTGQEGKASLALAEEALLMGEPKLAQARAQDAQKKLPAAASPAALRAEDVIRQAKEVIQEMKDNDSALPLRLRTLRPFSS